MANPNYWPPQPGPMPPPPPMQPAPTRRPGLPAWAGIVAAVALIAGAWFGAGAIVSPHAQAATGDKSPATTSAARPAAGGQVVSTATRPPQSSRTYADPLPDAFRPAGDPKVTSLDTYSKGDFAGRFDGQTTATYKAWMAKLKTAGFAPTPGQKNDNTSYDLSKGHTRILGDFLAEADAGHGSITFVYDEAGS